MFVLAILDKGIRSHAFFLNYLLRNERERGKNDTLSDQKGTIKTQRDIFIRHQVNISIFVGIFVVLCVMLSL